MSRFECEREQEILDAVAAGRWPHGGVNELQLHTSACASCRDLVTVALAIASDHAIAARNAHVPTSGVAWWRAQRRAREEAARKATRAVTAVQAASVAIGIVAAIAVVSAMSVPSDLWSAFLSSVQTVTPWWIPFGVALTAWLVLAPVALYFAVADD